MIAELGLDAALDAVYEETKAYVSPDFYDELQYARFSVSKCSPSFLESSLIHSDVRTAG